MGLEKKQERGKNMEMLKAQTSFFLLLIVKWERGERLREELLNQKEQRFDYS